MIEFRQGVSRPDIKNAEVMKYIDQGLKPAVVCGYFGCSADLIRKIIRGDRYEHHQQYSHRMPIQKPKRRKKQKMCTACNAHAVKPGNRFLCKRCYSANKVRPRMAI